MFFICSMNFWLSLQQENQWIWRASTFIYKNSWLLLRKVQSLPWVWHFYIYVPLNIQHNMSSPLCYHLSLKMDWSSCLPHFITGTTVFLAIKSWKLMIIFKCLLVSSYPINCLRLWRHLLTTFILITTQLDVAELHIQMGRWWVTPKKV